MMIFFFVWVGNSTDASHQCLLIFGVPWPGGARVYLGLLEVCVWNSPSLVWHLPLIRILIGPKSVVCPRDPTIATKRTRQKSRCYFDSKGANFWVRTLYTSSILESFKNTYSQSWAKRVKHSNNSNIATVSASLLFDHDCRQRQPFFSSRILLHPRMQLWIWRSCT